MTGRPTKFNAQLAAQILVALKAGITRDVAIAAAGIARSTFYAWLDRGKNASCGELSDFSDAIRQAEAEAAIRNITIIQKAALGGELLEKSTVTKPNGTVVVTEKWTAPDWRAAVWWLERKFPDEWGRKVRIDYRGPG
jgi:hypothetical protein